jgi:hypothetical protein
VCLAVRIRLIGSTRFCRFPPAASNAMGLNTTAIERSLCMRRWIPPPAVFMEKTAARYTSQDFIAFLKDVVALCPSRQKIHIILDNLSAHKTTRVRVPGAESARMLPLHANIFLLAKPG